MKGHGLNGKTDRVVTCRRNADEVLAVLDYLSKVSSWRVAIKIEFAGRRVDEESCDVIVGVLLEAAISQQLSLGQKLFDLAWTFKNDFARSIAGIGHRWAYGLTD